MTEQEEEQEEYRILGVRMVTLFYDDDDDDVQGLDTISGFQPYGDMLSPKDQTKD